MEDIKQLLDLAKENKSKAAIILLLIVLINIFSDYAKKSITDIIFPNPFHDVDGEYKGRTESAGFTLCLHVLEDKVDVGTGVIGSMTWDNDPANDNFVYYLGRIEENRIEFTYERNENHPVPDNGTGFIYVKQDGYYNMIWKSAVRIKMNHSLITKTPNRCKVFGWDSD